MQQKYRVFLWRKPNFVGLHNNPWRLPHTCPEGAHSYRHVMSIVSQHTESRRINERRGTADRSSDGSRGLPLHLSIHFHGGCLCPVIGRSVEVPRHCSCALRKSVRKEAPTGAQGREKRKISKTTRQRGADSKMLSTTVITYMSIFKRINTSWPVGRSGRWLGSFGHMYFSPNPTRRW